jgi:predicted metal-binding membrane protein
LAVQAAHKAPEFVSANHDGGTSRRQFLLCMGMLVTLAWLTLWIWEQSPYGRYLDHGRWTEIGLAGSICRVLPNGTVVLPALLYVGGWVLMTAAMMLPTTIPLLEIFRRLTRRRQDAGRLVTLVMVGYLTVWLLFGVAAHLLDWGVNETVRQSVWLGLNGWVLGVIVLGIAGVFQFTDLKYRCLDRCRAPLSFILRHWRGGDAQRQAVAIGVHHGIYCVGCCWALMLLMFIVGTGSVGWMLLLGAVMAIEKNLPIGRLLGKPLGGVLIAGAAIVAFQNDALSLL